MNHSRCDLIMHCFPSGRLCSLFYYSDSLLISLLFLNFCYSFKSTNKILRAFKSPEFVIWKILTETWIEISHEYWSIGNDISRLKIPVYWILRSNCKDYVITISTIGFDIYSKPGGKWTTWAKASVLWPTLCLSTTCFWFFIAKSIVNAENMSKKVTQY